MSGVRARQVIVDSSRPNLSKSSTGDLGIVLVLVLVVGGMLLVSYGGGASGIPRADDWSYLLTQFEFAHSGQFIMNNWAVTMLIGQTLVAAPVVAAFGPNIALLQGLVAVMSAGALAVTYGFIRIVLPIGWTAFAVVTLAVSPIFGPSVVSFMTDVPALLFLSLSLWVGIYSLRGDVPNWSLFALSGLIAIVAFTFRDYAIIGFVAVVLVGWIAARSWSVRFGLGSGLVIVAAVAGGLYLWRHSLPNDLRLDGWGLGFSIQLVARGMLTIALLSIPALAALMWWRLFRSSLTQSLGICLGALALSIGTLVVAGFELLGNVIHPFGSTWLISGQGIRIWPLWANRMLLILATVSLAAFFVLVWSIAVRPRSVSWWAGSRDWVRKNQAGAVIVLFPFVLLATHAAATIALGTWFIDRYFILVLPFLIAAVVIVGRVLGVLAQGRLVAVPIAFLIAYGLWGLCVVDFDARFDGARWQIGERLVEEGYAPHEVDAGMQWVSFHALDVGLGAQAVPTRPGRQWWTERYPDQRVCVTVVATNSLEPSPENAIDKIQVETLFANEYTLVAVPGPDLCEAPRG